MSPFDIPVLTDMTEAPATLVVGAAPRMNRRGPKPGAPQRPKVAAVLAPAPGVTPPITRNWKSGEYKPPLAMRLALERAREHQPPLVMLSSLVRQDSVVRGEDK